MEGKERTKGYRKGENKGNVGKCKAGKGDIKRGGERRGKGNGEEKGMGKEER